LLSGGIDIMDTSGIYRNQADFNFSLTSSVLAIFAPRLNSDVQFRASLKIPIPDKSRHSHLREDTQIVIKPDGSLRSD
jgi:hypothetical protein